MNIYTGTLYIHFLLFVPITNLQLIINFRLFSYNCIFIYLVDIKVVYHYREKKLHAYCIKMKKKSLLKNIQPLQLPLSISPSVAKASSTNKASSRNTFQNNRTLMECAIKRLLEEERISYMKMKCCNISLLWSAGVPPPSPLRHRLVVSKRIWPLGDQEIYMRVFSEYNIVVLLIQLLRTRKGDKGVGRVCSLSLKH